MKIKSLCGGLSILLYTLAAVSQLVQAQVVTSTNTAPNAIPANTPTAVRFIAIVTGHPVRVELIYLNDPVGHPTFVGRLEKEECRDQDGTPQCRDHDDGPVGKVDSETFTLSKRFSLPAGQAQFRILAIGMQSQAQSSVIPILSLTTPLGFTIDTPLLVAGGPLNFTNFNGNYEQGGIIPESGVDIHIATLRLPRPPLDNYIDIELVGTTITSRTSLTVSGVACTQVFYTIAYMTTLTYKNETIYCPSGKLLYRFNLSYHAGDPHESQFLSSFQRVVSNAQFAQ